MYVDFTNLNKVFLKDNYPLPFINELVDRASRTKIIYDWGPFFYKVMPLD